MYICRNCGQAYSVYAPRCSRCGGEVVAAAPVEPVTHTYAPYGAAPAYHYEARPPRPVATGGTIALGVFGFIFALEALFGFFVSAAIVSASYNPYRYSYYDGISTFVIAMFFHLVISVLGLVFSSVARNKGFCGLGVAGKVLGIIGIVINSIICFFLILGLQI